MGREEISIYGKSPNSGDRYGNRISDLIELKKGMDPLNPDSDQDLMIDTIDPLPLFNNFNIIMPFFGIGGVAIWIYQKLRAQQL